MICDRTNSTIRPRPPSLGSLSGVQDGDSRAQDRAAPAALPEPNRTQVSATGVGLQPSQGENMTTEKFCATGWKYITTRWGA